MPVITVTLIEGYDEATRRGLAERLADAAVPAAPRARRHRDQEAAFRTDAGQDAMALASG